MNILKYAVIGAGAGGTSVAAQLKSKGHTVKLAEKRKEVVEVLNALDTFTVSGKIECQAKPDLITESVTEAVTGADVVVIVTTTDAHSDIAKQIAEIVNQNQIFVLMPGHIGGALNFINTLKVNGCKSIPVVAETGDLPYGCRTMEIGHTKHTGVKAVIKLGSIPAANAQKVIDVIGSDFPMLVPAKDVWDADFIGNNALLHVIPCIMNINKVDSGEPFDYYIEGITPSICKIIEAADKEISAVYDIMRVKNDNILGFMHNVYHLNEYNNLYDALQHNQSYVGIKPPKSTGHRFFQEDMLCTLVPLVSIGKMFGINMPVLESFIYIESAITGQDFMKDGRTVESLGLNGKTIDEIYEIIK